MMDYTVEGVYWTVLTTLFQLGMIIAVKACGFLLIAYVLKWYAKRNPDKFPKFQTKDKPKPEDEFNYESDWEDVDANVPNPSGATDSDFEDEQVKNSGAELQRDEWMTETDKLLAQIRHRRIKDDMIQENLFTAQKRNNPKNALKPTLSLREMLRKYKPN